jgi:hypothetical protein
VKVAVYSTKNIHRYALVRRLSGSHNLSACSADDKILCAAIIVNEVTLLPEDFIPKIIILKITSADMPINKPRIE